MSEKAYLIAVDFDGTCVEHCFPDVGPDVPGAVDWLKRFVVAGASLILWTMRSDGPPRRPPAPDTVMSDALEWFHAREIPLIGANENPSQASWTSSPKVFAHKYIDDAAAGCPLVINPRQGARPYVDWDRIGPGLLAEIERHALVAGAAK